MIVQDEALFSSAHAAMVFAFNFSGQQYDKSMMARMASTPGRDGKGLGGLDGAAQAGMIRAELAHLCELHASILIARVAPPTIPCECRHACCSGHKPNTEWVDAIIILTQLAMGELSGHLSHYLLRRGIIERYFGAKHSIGELADQCGVNRDTASAHNAKLVRWLKGQPGKLGADGSIGQETRAWNAITDRLDEAGMIESKKYA